MHHGLILSVAKYADLGYNHLDIPEGRMRMKVLLINGSPKGEKSNTYRLSQAFLDGMHSDEARTLCVRDLDIKPCRGCFACWNKTPGKCCISDDMSGVIENILWADVILWSFPLYYFSVPGPLKNLMDRQLPMVLPFMTADSESGGHPSRYDMSGKRHVVISTCGFFTAEGNYDGVNSIFDHLCGKGNFTSIYCGQGELFRVKELSQRTDEYLSWISNAGTEFVSGGISLETREKLSQLLYPREVFEAMADASWGVEQTGEKSDETLVFTRQMAALYNKSAWAGKDLVLEMCYTDVDKRYQIVLGKEGSRVITDNFLTATTTIETSYTLWKAIAAGEENGQDALMQQKYRVKGDFSLMIQWDKYFGSQEPEKLSHNAENPTNMTLLLLPWMAFRISTAAVNAFYGALISIAVCAAVPLIFRKNRAIIFDHLSAAAVSLCAVLLILEVPLSLVLPVSYLCFGLMWTINGVTKVPLTAHYSINDYGSGMMENSLFIKTNRILTLCWGILYLMMTVWTYVLLRMGADWISTVNSVLPMLLGLFTVWFQKWYPAHVARGS